MALLRPLIPDDGNLYRGNAMGAVVLRPQETAPLFRSCVGGRFSGWEEAEALS